MSRWLGLCDRTEAADVERAVRAADPSGELELVRDADALRMALLSAEPSECAAVVGEVAGGVSGVNLAAALVRDGNARMVVLACRAPSGSLRSRAARAGVDLVVDLDATVGGGVPGGPVDGGRIGFADATSADVRPGVARCPVIVLCSGRGGVGKTSVAAVAAAQAAAWGMRVSLVDLDLSCGNAHALLGVSDPSDLSLLAGQAGVSAELVEELSVAAPSGVRVLGPCARPETAELAMPLAGALLDRASEASDLVLVDTSPTFTDAVAQAAQRADRLVVVTDGRAGSVAALARTGGLAVRLGVARTRISRLENRANPRARTDFSLARAEVGLEAARVFRAFEGGDEVSDLLASGLAADLVGSGSPFADSVATVTAQLLLELGRLPNDEGAARAAESSTTRRWPSLFGRKREVG